MSSGITPFAFGEKLIRVQMDENGTPWFVAKDMALALGYSVSSLETIGKLIQHVPDEWKDRKRIPVRSGNDVEQEREAFHLSEQGLYFFLGRSDKPGALPFQKWLAGEVLPTLRKTRRYEIPRQKRRQEEELPPWPEDREQVTDRICFLSSEFPSERERFIRMAFRLAEVADLTDADDVYELSVCCAKLFHTRENLIFPATPVLSPDKLARVWREVQGEAAEGKGKKLERFLTLYRVLERFMERENARQELCKALSSLAVQYTGEAPRSFEITVAPRRLPA